MKATAASLGLWILYLAVPVAGWGWLDGRPLGVLSTIALAAVCWVTFARGSVGFWRVAAVVLALKIGLGMTMLVPRGFEARYYANAAFAAPVESSIESPGSDITRIDRRLRFGIDGAPDLPLAFFNEVRFNYYRDTEPARATLPFSVMWQGVWRVDGGSERLYVHSPDGPVLLTIGNNVPIRIDPAETWSTDVDLPKGFHRVALAWSVPQGGSRRFEAGRIVNGREVPFDDSTIVQRRVGRAALAADAIVGGLSRILDALLIAGLAALVVTSAVGAWRRLRDTYTAHDALSLLWMVGIVDALVLALPSLTRMVTLTGGDDWLTYESEARDIALHGLWMTEGAALGHGSAFYGQPLYPYFLAACHWLFGDGLFGALFVQRLMVAGTVIALWRTAALLFDERVALATLVTAIIVAYEKLAGWSGVLLTETLFTPVVCFWVYLVVRLARAPDPRRLALAAGLVGGLATLARSSLLLGWLIVVPLLAIVIPRRRYRLTAMALLLSTMIAVASLATLRNWVVARQFVLISSEGPVVLFLGNSPPALTTPPAYQAAYDFVRLDPRVQAVAEYARQQPRAFGRQLWRKARFTLGWFDEMLPGSGTSVFYIAVWMSALAGVVLLWSIPPTSKPLALLPLLLALSHFAAVVLFQPHVYGDRLIMPLYLLLVPFAALPLATAARVADRFGRDRAAAALCGGLLLAAIARLLGWFPAVDIDVLAVAILAAGLCLVGLPSVVQWRHLAYAIYLGGLAVWFIRSPTGDSAATLRAESLFIALAVIAPALLTRPQRFADDPAPHSAIRNPQWIGWMFLAAVGIGSAILARNGIPTGVLDRFGESLRIALGYTGALASFVGIGTAAIVLTLPRHMRRARRTLVYTAGAAMTIAALQWAGAMIAPGRALLKSEVATIGFIGAAAYAAIWLDAARPTGDDLSRRGVQGMAVGFFVITLFGAVIGRTGAALPVAAGLLVAVIQADRRRVRIG